MLPPPDSAESATAPDQAGVPLFTGVSVFGAVMLCFNFALLGLLLAFEPQEFRILTLEDSWVENGTALLLFLTGTLLAGTAAVGKGARWDLPAHRKPHGFDNLDFHWGEADGGDDVRYGGKCVAVVRLPDYPIVRIRTGQWIPDERRNLWRVEFQVGPKGAESQP